RGEREYLAEISQYPPPGPRILSREDPDQGWSWRELDDAITALTHGPERTRQRRHFDALTLLGVFLQHGDRKPEQQVLYCDAPIDLAAGSTKAWSQSDGALMMLEAPGKSACAHAAATIVDLGATFGGA